MKKTAQASAWAAQSSHRPGERLRSLLLRCHGAAKLPPLESTKSSPVEYELKIRCQILLVETIQTMDQSMTKLALFHWLSTAGLFETMSVSLEGATISFAAATPSRIKRQHLPATTPPREGPLAGSNPRDIGCTFFLAMQICKTSFSFCFSS
jgi:hypothetical protein